MIAAWSNHAALRPGIKVAVGQPDECGRIQASFGTAIVTRPDGNYEDGAILPGRVWRDLSSDDREALFHPDKRGEHQAEVRVVTIPPDKLSPFRRLRECASRSGLDQVRCEASDPWLHEAIDSCATYARVRFGIGGHGCERLTGGIRVDAANLRTVTINSETGKFVGLHVDNWSRFPLAKRHAAPNRICINLGNDARYLLFLNLSVGQLLAEALNSSVDDDARQEIRCALEGTGGTTVGRAFMTHVPDYPVLRLKIYPGEAYIAPTESIIHDGSSSGARGPDVSLSLRGGP